MLRNIFGDKPALIFPSLCLSFACVYSKEQSEKVPACASSVMTWERLQASREEQVLWFAERLQLGSRGTRLPSPWEKHQGFAHSISLTQHGEEHGCVM